ncbi:hypothetical protein [Subtercola lobariae]|uniref:hypothetical protein n=1 Tax=Subtercola lobariae TaxID=1588641 RepID=UPI00166BBBFC|nr:hypothetical protein [Subtercola lobariae]
MTTSIAIANRIDSTAYFQVFLVFEAAAGLVVGLLSGILAWSARKLLEETRFPFSKIIPIAVAVVSFGAGWCAFSLLFEETVQSILRTVGGIGVGLLAAALWVAWPARRIESGDRD